MRWTRLGAGSLTALLAALLAGCAGGRPTRPLAVPASATITLPDTLRVRVEGRVVSVPLEDYVLGSALSEVGPVGESPETTRVIFEVQAILARSYAAGHLGRHAAEGFDLCDSTHCQVYQPGRIRTSRFAAVARQAVADTRGEVVSFAHRIAETLFHADCGGYTETAERVWGNPVPYLVGAPDIVPPDAHRRWETDVTPDRLRDILDSDARSAVGRHLTSVRIAVRDASGRAAEIEVRGDRTRILRGEQLRAILNQTLGAAAIRSTRLTITRVGQDYRLSGTGWGHGVGLCQLGAAARARRGDSVAQILAAYYPGTQLVRAARTLP